MHYLYRYVCILNVFFYMCIWTIVCNKEFIIRILESETIESSHWLLTKRLHFLTKFPNLYYYILTLLNKNPNMICLINMCISVIRLLF